MALSVRRHLLQTQLLLAGLAANGQRDLPLSLRGLTIDRLLHFIADRSRHRQRWACAAIYTGLFSSLAEQVCLLLIDS